MSSKYVYEADWHKYFVDENGNKQSDTIDSAYISSWSLKMALRKAKAMLEDAVRSGEYEKMLKAHKAYEIDIQIEKYELDLEQEEYSPTLDNYGDFYPEWSATVGCASVEGGNVKTYIYQQ